MLLSVVLSFILVDLGMPGFVYNTKNPLPDLALPASLSSSDISSLIHYSEKPSGFPDPTGSHDYSNLHAFELISFSWDSLSSVSSQVLVLIIIYFKYNFYFLAGLGSQQN